MNNKSINKSSNNEHNTIKFDNVNESSDDQNEFENPKLNYIIKRNKNQEEDNVNAMNNKKMKETNLNFENNINFHIQRNKERDKSIILYFKKHFGPLIKELKFNVIYIVWT